MPCTFWLFWAMRGAKKLPVHETIRAAALGSKVRCCLVCLYFCAETSLRPFMTFALMCQGLAGRYSLRLRACRRQYQIVLTPIAIKILVKLALLASWKREAAAQLQQDSQEDVVPLCPPLTMPQKRQFMQKRARRLGRPNAPACVFFLAPSTVLNRPCLSK